MQVDMKEIIETIKEKEKEFIMVKMEIYMKANLKMVKRKEKE